MTKSHVSIRRRVDDPAIAETLIPKDHGFGSQRVHLETCDYEAFNRDNADLMDLKETPLECITATGLRTSSNSYEFDIIVYAAGFDANTGLFDRVDIHCVVGAWSGSGRGDTARLGARRTGHLSWVACPRLPQLHHGCRAAKRLRLNQLSPRYRAEVDSGLAPEGRAKSYGSGSAAAGPLSAGSD